MRALKIYCEHNGITEFEIYTDENISGAKESRPSLNRLMADVEADRVSQVVCFSFIRFARSTTHLLKGLQKFKDKGVLFVSLSEKVDTGSAMGMAIFTILGAISQLERELIAESSLWTSRSGCSRENSWPKKSFENRYSFVSS